MGGAMGLDVLYDMLPEGSVAGSDTSLKNGPKDEKTLVLPSKRKEKKTCF